MKNNPNSMPNMAFREFTQFDFTKNLINNLQQFNITPVSKLVLIYLSTCYNPKNADVFPRQKTISQNLGISERSVVRSIAELIKNGLIISECGKNNRYRFTNALRIKNFNADKLSEEKCKNYTLQNDKLSDTCIEQINEEKKELVFSVGCSEAKCRSIEVGSLRQRSEVNDTTEWKKKQSTTESINIQDFNRLKEYAASKGAKNAVAYAKVLIKNGSAKEILEKLKEKEKIELSAKRRIAETQERIKKFRSFKYEPIPDDIKKRADELIKRLKMKG